jgi:23S rRNA (guanosine2251-2'-O)-methyltransferase
MLASAEPVNNWPAAVRRAKPSAMTRHRTTRPRGPQGDGKHTPALIYGWHSAVAALQNPRRRIQKILATRNALQRLVEIGIANLPSPADPREIDRLVGHDSVHQGIAVLADPLPEVDLESLMDAALLVVLDQVTDPHNVGAVLRSAAAFEADAIVLTERHGPADTGVLAKAASGGLEHVPLVRVTNLARAMDQLADMGFLRLGLDSAHAEPLEAIDPGGKVAIALGAEGKGLRRLTREKCDHLVRIEAPGPIASLNVSNAAALALYVLSRRIS